MTNVQKEIIVRGVKIIDIGYITILYFFIGIYLAKAFDNYLGTFDKELEEKKGFWRRTLELIGLIWLYGIVIYIVKNLVEIIPYPLNGISGFNHLLMKELKNATLFIFIFLGFQKHFKDRIVYYIESTQMRIF